MDVSLVSDLIGLFIIVVGGEIVCGHCGWKRTVLLIIAIWFGTPDAELRAPCVQFDQACKQKPFAMLRYFLRGIFGQGSDNYSQAPRTSDIEDGFLYKVELTLLAILNMLNLAVGLGPVPFASGCAIFILLHAFFWVISPKASPLPEVSTAVDTKSDRKRERKSKPTVLVTGGCGLVGSRIVEHLRRRNTYAIQVVDLFLPRPEQRVDGVIYFAANLTTGDLSESFQGVDAVIHCAGIVVLYDDYGALHNAHIVATQQVVLAAKQAGCGAMVFTSSCGGWHTVSIASSMSTIRFLYTIHALHLHIRLSSTYTPRRSRR
jgi:hypothetical protein